MNSTRVLWWKEYREQQGVWLVTLLTAVVLGIVMVAVVRPYDQFSAQKDEVIRTVLIAMVLILAATYGVVCGAMLLAGEREGGTDSFLDMLPAARSRVWRDKVTVGLILVLAHVGILSLLSIGLEILPQGWFAPNWFLFVLILALVCYACSLCAAPLCRTVLAASALSAPFILLGWSVAVMLSIPMRDFSLFWLMMLVPLALTISYRLYCTPDRTRRGRRTLLSSALATRWGVLLWLVWRQGKLEFLILLGCLILVTPMMASEGIWLWPMAALAIGLVCGTEVFAQDQAEGCRFLGNQRLPPGLLWTFKTSFWFLVAALATSVLLINGILSTTARQILQPTGEGPRMPDVVGQFTAENLIGAAGGPLFLIVWVLYGFGTGLLFGQLARKQVIALLGGLTASICLLLVWLPSLATGSVFTWQVAFVPVVLVLTSRLLMWPWLAGYLGNWRTLLALCLCALVIVAWIGGSLWYRVAEIPDVEEPFNVNAFIAALPVGDEADQRRRDALEEMNKWVDKVAEKKHKAKGANEPGEGVPAGGDSQTKLYQEAQEFRRKLEDLLQERNIDQDANVSAWLNEIFAGDWDQKLSKAVAGPLGMLIDPRQYRVSGKGERYYLFAQQAGTYLNGRAGQFLERKQPDKALPHLLTALALSQQTRSKAFPRGWISAQFIEEQTLDSVAQLLSQAKARPELLRPLLPALIKQDQQMPPIAEMIKADYLDWDHWFWKTSWRPTTGWETHLLTLLHQAPWESERRERLVKLILASELHLASLPSWQLPPLEKGAEYSWLRQVKQTGLNLPNSPGAALSVGQWENILEPLESFRWLGYQTLSMCHARAKQLHRLRVAQLQTALALHEAEQKSAAQSLNELVPRYLPAVPVDPLTGSVFLLEGLKPQPLPE